MTRYTIIDRRTNPKGKNLSNRQRFLGRSRGWLKEKVRKRSIDRGITSKDGESISISGDDISEPVFNYNTDSGDWDRVLPGNKEFVPGDTIDRPRGGAGGGGKNASDNGDGDDEFVFSITKEEYLSILFEDLELPDLVKESENSSVTFERRRTGFSTAGTPNNLDLEKSLKNALGRRIALGFPLDKKIKEKEKEIEEEEDQEKLEQLKTELSTLIKRRLAIAFIDQVDVRYRRYSQIPIPNSQAIVFCLMDVSGSMEEIHKEIAKRFFLLLYLFLERKYDKVDIRFIKHTTEAKECDEQEFFYGVETGGTLVSTGVKKINEIIINEYPLDQWNIYVVQASDGDNVSTDNIQLKAELRILLPKCQYYVYNEVKSTNSSMYGDGFPATTNVYDTLSEIAKEFNNLTLVNIDSVEEVVPIFRRIFGKNKNGK